MIGHQWWMGYTPPGAPQTTSSTSSTQMVDNLQLNVMQWDQNYFHLRRERERENHIDLFWPPFSMIKRLHTWVRMLMTLINLESFAKVITGG